MEHHGRSFHFHAAPWRKHSILKVRCVCVCMYKALLFETAATTK